DSGSRWPWRSREGSSRGDRLTAARAGRRDRRRQSPAHLRRELERREELLDVVAGQALVLHHDLHDEEALAVEVKLAGDRARVAAVGDEAQHLVDALALLLLLGDLA